MALLSRRFPAYFISSLLLLYIQPVYTKECKKINACRCEMDDGSGVIDLWDLGNKDGTPRYPDIPEDSLGSPYTYNFNPCTPVKSIAACTESNLCQKDTTNPDIVYYACGQTSPTFTVDLTGNVVLNFKEFDGRASQITLVCDQSNAKGSFGNGITQTNLETTLYSGTLSVKSACLVPSDGLSTGSIMLIVFFPLVFLYVVFGIVFNVYVRHKQAIPDVCPNHTFWGALPFLVKDGCVFSCGKLKHCCSFLYYKSRGEPYQDI